MSLTSAHRPSGSASPARGEHCTTSPPDMFHDGLARCEQTGSRSPIARSTLFGLSRSWGLGACWGPWRQCNRPWGRPQRAPPSAQTQRGARGQDDPVRHVTPPSSIPTGSGHNEHLIGLKPVRQRVGAPGGDLDQILQVPVAKMGLKGQPHPCFQRLMAGGNEVGLLLVPPRLIMSIPVAVR